MVSPQIASLTEALSQMRFFDEPVRRQIPTEALGDYEPGHLIESCRPFAKALFRERKGELCDYCLKPDGQLKRCKSCEKFFYCSKECQIADWNHAHKYKECQLYRRDKKNILNKSTATTRLIARIYLIIRYGREGADNEDLASHPLYKDYTCFNGHKRNFKELVSHFDQYKDNPKFRHLIGYKDIYKAIMLPNYDWNSDDLLHIFTRIVCNSFEIAKINETDQSREDPSALALYIEMSIFDHSCDPNCMFKFEGDEMKLLARRPIKKGEQLFVQYLEVEPVHACYKTLRMFYYFVCHCTRCEALSPVEKSKYEFDVWRHEFYGHSCRGNNIKSLLVLKKMNKYNLDCTDPANLMDADLENVSAIFTRAQSGDLIDDRALYLAPYDEIIQKNLTNPIAQRATLVSQDLVEFVKGCDKHKIARQLYKRGDFIRNKIPNYYVLLPELKSKYCDLCLAKFPRKTRFVCHACHKFFYCSKECQTTDKIVHQTFECAINMRDRSGFLRINENAKTAYYIRMYVSVREMPVDFRYRDEAYFEDKSDLIDGLTTNKQPKSLKNRNSYKVLLENFNTYPPRFGHPMYDILDFVEAIWPEYVIDDVSLVDLFSFAHTNMFNIYEGDKILAIGSFSSFQMAERSLKPTSELILQDGKLSLRATHELKPGDSITLGCY